MNLPEKFRTLRTAKELSVYKLSKLSDVSENYIHKIEKGGTQPSVAILEKLLGCLGTTLSEFFNDGQAAMYPTDFERDLIESIRILTEEKAAAVLQITKLLSKR